MPEIKTSAKTDYLSTAALCAEKYGTPFYLLDKDEVINRVSEIKLRLPENAKLCYAIKSNAFLTDFLKDEDILFEVCSPGELSICEKYGLSPDKIVFSGVVKSLEDVKRAYLLKVHTITLESPLHCEYLLKTVKTLEGEGKELHQQNVILRLTGGNQFGMSEKDLEECITKILQVPSIKIRGIHYFTGTQKKFKTIQEEIPFIEEYCTKLVSKFSLEGLEIEYGAGLPYEYFPQPSAMAKDGTGTGITAKKTVPETTDAASSENNVISPKDDYSVLEDFSKLIENSSFNYVIELGRYVASPCGKYVTKIMDVKGDEKNNYCLIDGGINHINYYGQMMGMKNPVVDHIQQKTSGLETGLNFTIAGSLCTTADIVLRKLPLSNPQPGDLLVFNDIGAYSITEGIYLFLSHPLPAVLASSTSKAGSEQAEATTEVTVLRKSEETYKINS